MCRAAGRGDIEGTATRQARHKLADALEQQALAAAGTDRAPALWARVAATRPRPYATPPPGMGFFAGDPLRDAGMRGAMEIGGDF